MKKILSVLLSIFVLANIFVPYTYAQEYAPSSGGVNGNYETGKNGSVIFDNSDCYINEDELPESPTLSFSIDVKDDGYYYVWLNAKATMKASSGDSIWIGVDNDNYVVTPLNVSEDEFQWVRASTINLTAGTHTIDFIPREPYLEILNIMIVDKSSYLPWDNSPYSIPSFNPQGLSHPRVLINEENIASVRANLNDPDNVQFLKMHNDALLNEVSEDTTTVPGIAKFNVELNSIKSYAFEYVINDNETYGNKAIELVKTKLEKLNFNEEADYTQLGNFVYTIALVYDWCYPLLTDVDKEYIIENTLRIQSLHSQIGWPPVKLSGFGGHGSESGLLRDMLAFGIAIFDENNDVYNVTAGRIIDEYVAPRNLYYSSHKSLFGTSYGIYRGKHDITAMLLFKGIGKEDIFEEQISKFPYWYIYGTRGDRHYMDDGDTKINWSTTSKDKGYSASYAYLALASLYQDGILKDAFYKEDAVLTDEYLEALIINDVDLTTDDIYELPYSKYFPYPGGSYIARTGWNDDKSENPSVVVTMKVNELNIMDHNHQDAGGFQIYYKGNLATDSGYYQTVREGEGCNDTTGEYYLSYYKQSIAHNTMLIYDENEPSDNFIQGATGVGVNSGGQIMPSKNSTVDYPKTAEELANDERFNTSKVIAHEHNEDVIDPDYTYLKGDLTNAYSDKVENYERSFMFLNLKNDETPAALIVFDRVVASNLKYKKTYLLHGIHSPQIDEENQRVVITRADKNQFGNDYNGKLINDTLLPKNATITQVGENENDYIINGENHPTTGYVDALGNARGLNEGGGIRTEISPSTYRKKDYFLNVMQVTDADSESESLESILIETDTHTGVQIADRVVLFGNEKDRQDGDVVFSVSGDEEYKITVADLEEGKWNVFRDGVFHSTVNVSEEGGVASFTATSGDFIITRNKGLSVYVSSGNFGDIAPSGEHTVAPGYELTLDIMADNGYKLKSITANDVDITVAVKNDKVIVKITEDTNIFAEFEKINADATLSSASTFYRNFGEQHLGEYKGKNSFLAFSRITNIVNSESIVDYGMLVKEGEGIPLIDDEATVKVSQFQYNGAFEGQDNRVFGIIFYGDDIKNFSQYSLRPYIVFNLNGTTVVKYGDVYTDYAVNSTKYPISRHQIDE